MEHVLFERAHGVEHIVSDTLWGRLASLGTVEAPGRAITGGAGVFAVTLGLVVCSGVAGGTTFSIVGRGGGVVAPLCQVGQSMAMRALFKRVRGYSPLHQDTLPEQEDGSMGVGASTNHSIGVGVISVNQDE